MISLFYDYKFVESQTSQEVRDQLEQKTIENLQQMIVEESLPRPENWQNKRYLIRTIERRSKTIPRDLPTINQGQADSWFETAQRSIGR